jgi:hypothetical protein
MTILQAPPGMVGDARLGPFASQELLDKAKSGRRGHVFNQTFDSSKQFHAVREVQREAKPFWRPG